jgi:hypothetical protein
VASSGVEAVVGVSLCRVSTGTDLIEPFGVFEKDGELLEGLLWLLGFAPPFKVFMACEETGERVRVGADALIVSILRGS